MLNNFDTGNVFAEIDELIKATNTYLTQPDVKLPLLNSINDYLLRLFGVLGINYNEEANQSSER